MRKFALKVNDGDELIGYAWEVENPVANIVIFQGMEEHSLRYDCFAKVLNEHKINAYSLDCYGQGANVKPDYSNESVWPSNGFIKMVDAHNQMVEEAKKNGAKTYVYAHSMGSFMGQYYIQRYPNAVEKIILCGTGSKNPALPIAIQVAKLLNCGKRKYKKSGIGNKLMFGGFNKTVKNPDTDFDWLSMNKENVKGYVEDPLCGFGPTNDFIYQFCEFMSHIYTKDGLNGINKKLKIFLISGAEDPVTNFGKCTQIMFDLYKSLGVEDVSKKIYPNARHELHFENCKEEATKDIIDFFLK